MSTLPAKIDRNMSARQEFGASETQNQAELSVAAVAAREEATIKAEYVMAERHPRNWMDVRTGMLEHCKRYRFAEISRYSKPVGRKKVQGEWVDEKARGWSARFAETLAQEMGNVKPFSQVSYEDDLIRVMRIGVTDLQKNLPRSREVTFAKAVEKRGKQDKKTGDWSPPEGREVIGEPRLNTYGDPVWLVKATDDEMRNKVNSEESKTQRDFILKLCPRDILDECEDLVYRTIEAGDKEDPTAPLKRALDRFRELAGMKPSELEQYIGKACDAFTPADLQELRELYSAIRDGHTTFEAAMKAKYTAIDEEGNEIPGSAKEAEAVGAAKLAEMQKQAAAKKASQPASPTVGATHTGGEQPKGSAGAQPQPRQDPAADPWNGVTDLEDWPDDPMAPGHGLYIVVQGKRYYRDTKEDDSWKMYEAPQPAPPAAPKRPLNIGGKR